MFSMRIVNVDHYMSAPKSGFDLTYSQFRGAQVKSVPVFRIFGSTPSGNKACLHVHGVFPYILVPYSGDDDAGRLMYQLASSLDKAINVSQNTSYSTRQHVFKIIQVSGRPFYGFHSQDHRFLKIFFYNPLVVKRACDLLQNGAVCGTKFQIHEGHVPFTLQFFIDYNLYGMSFINLKNVVYRKDASPSGVTPGSLAKESWCELEADAVAVDIVNRLTIEGELAVNPGLAAIWQEEKVRLKRDALETSQRPEPLLAMSEVLLREKLGENLKFQGKCKTPLKETIPYPAETQGTTGNDILDASVLDTHSISSLASIRPNEAEETTIIDEELVLSLTQNSILSSPLDQSLILALENLADQHEVNVVMTQNVEDDSILGTQTISEQDVFGNDISDGESEALNYSLPPDLSSENHSEDESDEESNESFEGNIPQLDGVGDCSGKKKKSKQTKKKRRVLMENSATETYPLSEGEEILLNTIKDNNCWPEPGKQETLEEIFSDEEPYNSPINNFEDSCELLDLNTINVDLVSSFETVLRGDPSFTSGDLASEDVMFQPIDENVEDSGEKKTSPNEEGRLKTSGNVGDKKSIVDKNSNIDAVPSLNNSQDTTDMDKSIMLAISGEELLNTSQLDEILNDDLNKGLEIICEKSPVQEFKENWIRSRDTLNSSEVNLENELSFNSTMLETSDEVLHTVNIEVSEERIDEEMFDCVKGVYEEDYESAQALNNLEVEKVCVKPFINDVYIDENHPQIDLIPSLLEESAPPPESSKKKASSNTPKKNQVSKSSLKESLPKRSRQNLVIKLFSRKKSHPGCKHDYSFEMTGKEIETYYSQLEKVTKYISLRTDMENPQPMLWFPIRENLIVQSLGRKGERKHKLKITETEKIMKKCKFSSDEILKMKSCKVNVFKLTKDEISYISGKPILDSGALHTNQTDLNRNNVKQDRSRMKSLQNTSPSVKSLEKKMSVKESNVKQETSCEPIEGDTQKSQCPKKSPPKLSVPVFRLQEKSPKTKNINAKKSQFYKKSPKITSKKVSESCNIQDSTSTSLKKQKSSGKIQINKANHKKSKSITRRLSFLDDEKKINSKEKEKNGSSTGKAKETIKRDGLPSCENKNSAPIGHQSNNSKLNKKCVIKLLPLPVDKARKTPTKDLVVTDGFNGRVCSENTYIMPETFQEIRLDKVSTKKEVKKYNRNPLVRVEKLVSLGNTTATLEKEIKSDKESKKQRLSTKDGLQEQNDRSLVKSSKRKRPERIYSLDGTADSSSSDDDVEDKGNTSKPPEVAVLNCTPRKQRKSKMCSSPRNYVPLSIEIKKSPKLKPKSKTKDMIEPLVAERPSTEQKYEDGDIVPNSLIADKWNSSMNFKKRKLMNPLVSIKRLPSISNLHSDKSYLTDESPCTTSTSSHPLTKRLKVCVKRLSLDTQGDPLEHDRVAKLRGRFHRSSSLPITLE